VATTIGNPAALTRLDSSSERLRRLEQAVDLLEARVAALEFHLVPVAARASRPVLRLASGTAAKGGQ